MKQTALCFAVLFSLCGTEVGTCRAQQQPATVYLNSSRDWHVASGKQPWVHILARELTRQAFLLAARDEMGLVTRDAWLGDTRSPQDDSLPFDINTTPGNPLILEVVRGLPPQQVGLVRHELRRSGSINYRTWTVEVEALSRTKFVEALKQAGFQGQPSKRDEGLAVPENVESLLGEMNLFSQFHALRELHATIRSQGESAALLGGLVRGYANLGVMTEYYWHAAHKVFKARALLYAQRMVVREEESAVARWHRAYAAALTGLHAWALADLEEADQRWRALAEADRPVQPVWAQLIGPFCRYEIDALAEHVKDAKCKELAALLRYLSVEQAGCQAWAVQTAVQTVEIVPECYRVYDGLCQFVGVGTGHSATSAPVNLVGETVYGRVQAMPGLPEDVRRIVKERTSGGGLLGALFGKRPSRDEAELGVRRQLIDALLRNGKPSDAETDSAEQQGAVDTGEPSWAALGVLIRELNFMQVYRRFYFERYMLSVHPQTIAVGPLVDGHPCRVYLDTFLWIPGKVREAAAELSKMDVVGFAYPVKEFCEAIPDQKLRIEMLDKLWHNRDDVAADFVSVIRWYANRGVDPGKSMMEMLLKISPHSPLARSVLMQYHWDAVQDKVEQWDEASAPYPGLASQLAERYTHLGRWDDAERCLKAALKIVPSDLALYRQLAFIHLQRGDTALWVATLEECLKQPDYGLQHASVQSEIAGHYMRHKQWERALAYAEGAAQSYSAWGLLSAAQCNEGLQHWEEAEGYYRACDERYGGMHWYLFCRRTGGGDLERACDFAREYVKRLVDTADRRAPFDLIVYYLLEAKPEKASTEIERAVDKNPNAYDAIWMALIADQLKEDKKRDEALNRAKTIAAKTGNDQDANPDGAAGLADIIIKDLAQGGEGRIDFRAADKLAAPLDGTERLAIHYLLAQYLNLHGQPEAADRYWKRCMGYANMDALYRTLAGAALLEHDITAADYKLLLEPAEGEGQKAEDEQ